MGFPLFGQPIGQPIGKPIGQGGGNGKGYLFDIRTFTQSLDVELLTNPGNPFTFSSDDPTGWTVSGEVASDPMVNEVGAGEGHGGAGMGYVNFYSSATTNQPRISQSAVLTIGQLVEILTEINLAVAGTLAVGTAASNAGYSTALLFEQIRKVDNAQALILGSGAAPIDITVKRFSYKRITPNANQTTTLNTDIRMAFTLPASPNAGQQVGFWFRVKSPGTLFTDGIYIYLLRNSTNTAWDLKTDRYTSGTQTNIANLSANSAGTPTALRIVTNGDNISVYTSTGGIDGAFTQKGSTTAVTQNNTEVLAAPFSSSAAVSGITEFRAQAA